MPLQTAKLVKRTQLTSDVIELSFENLTPFLYQSGQFISLKVEDNPQSPVIRGYSLSSRPIPDSKNFDLCIKLLENGRGSTWLKNLPLNSEIHFLGPNGKFTFQGDETKNMVFVATGTGLAPIKAIIEDELINKNYHGSMQLIFGVRYINEVIYEDLFKKLAEDYPNFTYKITISRPELTENPYLTGRVTDIVKAATYDPSKPTFYICGLKAMLDETTTILRDKQIPEAQIFFEKFD